MLVIQDHSIYIRNYQEIMKMDRCLMKIKMENDFLKIIGENLEIYYFDHNEIRIHGQLKVIEYYDNRI